MIHTTFPIYNADAYALRNRDYFSSEPAKLLCPNNMLLPFQVAVGTTFSALTHITLKNAYTGATVVELLPKIDVANDIKVNVFASPAKAYVKYLGTQAFSGSYTIANGDYYIVINTGVGIYYSESFRVCSDLLTKGKFVKIQFYNAKDVDDIEPICYQDSWKQVIYLDTDIKASGHQTVEEVEEKDGYELPMSKSVYEIKRMRVTLSESQYRALIRMPLHSSITIWDRNNVSMTALRVKITDPAWSGGGAFCRVLIEFMTESATVNNTVLNMS